MDGSNGGGVDGGVRDSNFESSSSNPMVDSSEAVSNDVGDVIRDPRLDPRRSSVAAQRSRNFEFNGGGSNGMLEEGNHTNREAPKRRHHQLNEQHLPPKQFKREVVTHTEEEDVDVINSDDNEVLIVNEIPAEHAQDNPPETMMIPSCQENRQLKVKLHQLKIPKDGEDEEEDDDDEEEDKDDDEDYLIDSKDDDLDDNDDDDDDDNHVKGRGRGRPRGSKNKNYHLLLSAQKGKSNNGSPKNKSGGGYSKGKKRNDHHDAVVSNNAHCDGGNGPFETVVSYNTQRNGDGGSFDNIFSNVVTNNIFLNVVTNNTHHGVVSSTTPDDDRDSEETLSVDGDGALAGNDFNFDTSDNGIESPSSPRKYTTQKVIESWKEKTPFELLKCLWCPRYFETKVAKQKHITRRHPVCVSVYECSLCDFLTAFSTNANRHLPTHGINSTVHFRALVFNTHIYNNLDRSAENRYAVLAQAMYSRMYSKLSPAAREEMLDFFFVRPRVVLRWGHFPKWVIEELADVEPISGSNGLIHIGTNTMTAMATKLPTGEKDNIDDKADRMCLRSELLKEGVARETTGDARDGKSFVFRVSFDRYPRKEFWDSLKTLVKAYVVYPANVEVAMALKSKPINPMITPLYRLPTGRSFCKQHRKNPFFAFPTSAPITFQEKFHQFIEKENMCGRKINIQQIGARIQLLSKVNV